MTNIDQIHKQYNELIFKLILSKCFDEHLAEDIMQDTWIKFMRAVKTGSYNDDLKVRAYLATIAINTLKDHWKKSNKGIETYYDVVPDVIDDIDNPLEDNIEYLQRCISKLKPGVYKSSLQLRYDGLSYNEIAEEMACNRQSVGAYIHKGKEKLIDIWNQYKQVI